MKKNYYWIKKFFAGYGIKSLSTIVHIDRRSGNCDLDGPNGRANPLFWKQFSAYRAYRKYSSRRGQVPWNARIAGENRVAYFLKEKVFIIWLWKKSEIGLCAKWQRRMPEPAEHLLNFSRYFMEARCLRWLALRGQQQLLSIARGDDEAKLLLLDEPTLVFPRKCEEIFTT